MPVFSKDPVAVIVNMQNSMTDIAENVLQDIFAGEITRWKQGTLPGRTLWVEVKDMREKI